MFHHSYTGFVLTITEWVQTKMLLVYKFMYIKFTVCMYGKTFLSLYPLSPEFFHKHTCNIFSHTDRFLLRNLKQGFWLVLFLFFYPLWKLLHNTLNILSKVNVHAYISLTAEFQYLPALPIFQTCSWISSLLVFQLTSLYHDNQNMFVLFLELFFFLFFCLFVEVMIQTS